MLSTEQEIMEYCCLHNIRLTPLRKQILSIVLAQKGLIKAYDVLASLQTFKAKAAPPTVYRTLDYFVEIGLLHRVDALNGYVLCPHRDCKHHAIVMVCQQCGEISELDAQLFVECLEEPIKATGFQMIPQNIVLSGNCADCQNEKNKS